MCARYKDMKLSELMEMPLSEFQMKISSIPESEPLYKIIQSRTIKLSKIKDKDERKYWRELKRVNKIPNEYLSEEEILSNLKQTMKMVGGLK